MEKKRRLVLAFVAIVALAVLALLALSTRRPAARITNPKLPKVCQHCQSCFRSPFGCAAEVRTSGLMIVDRHGSRQPFKIEVFAPHVRGADSPS